MIELNKIANLHSYKQYKVVCFCCNCKCWDLKINNNRYLLTNFTFICISQLCADFIFSCHCGKSVIDAAFITTLKSLTSLGNASIVEQWLDQFCV